MKTLFHNVYDVKEENGRYCPVRFNDRQIQLLGEIHPNFGAYAHAEAGVSLVFDTEAEEFSFSYEYRICYTSIGGFDVYENGQLLYNEPLPSVSCEAIFQYKKLSKGKTRIEIYLPANAQMTFWDFSLGKFSFVASDAEKLILYYGDSLTQSAYICTPSLSFPTVASRKTATRFINRGIGSLFYEESALDEYDTVQPDVIFSEFGCNDLVKHENNQVVLVDGQVQYNDKDAIPELVLKAEAYLRKMQNVYPKAKICVISKIWSVSETTPQRMEVEKQYILEIEMLAQRLGMDYIEGYTLGSHIKDCYAADGIHLSALGGKMVGDSLAEYIQKSKGTEYE